MPGVDEKFLVVDEAGEAFVIDGLDELRKFYRANDIPWIYGRRVRTPSAPGGPEEDDQE